MRSSVRIPLETKNIRRVYMRMYVYGTYMFVYVPFSILDENRPTHWNRAGWRSRENHAKILPVRTQLHTRE